MSPEGLKDLLENLTVTNDVMKDVQTAGLFIKTYLYNQEAPIAETLINYELKKKFNLKNNDLRALISMYKDTVKDYQAGLKARKGKTEAVEIPEWYGFTDKGGLKFMPGILAGKMAEFEKVIYAAEQHHIYENGVYREMSEMEAQRMVQDKMIPSETKMSQITDAERQWRLQIQCDIKDLNANPFIYQCQGTVCTM